MSDSVQPHRWQPTRLPRPWDSLGKNTGVGCHCLLQCMKGKVKVKSLSRVQLCATHGLQPTRLLCPWDFPGESTGVGCHCLLLVKAKVAQSCPTLCNPMDHIVHGILQARILEWVAFPFSWGSSQPRDQTHVSHIAGGFFAS